MTPIAIAFVQLLYLVILYVPMGWSRLALPSAIRIGMGYLTANAIAMLVGYSLDMLGGYTTMRAFTIWLGICILLNLLSLLQNLRSAREDARPPLRKQACSAYLGGERPREPVPVEEVLQEPLLAWRHRRPRHLAPGEKYIYILAAIVMTATVWIRIADPVQNAALSGTDCYQFLNFYAWLLGEQQAIHDYPSGFALVTSMAPWTIQPYASVRWAPNLVFLACLPAAFGLWRRMGGAHFALAISFLLGSAWFLYPISAYHPHFIQWTTVFIGLPALLTIYARLARGDRPLPLILLAVPVNIAFTMTSAYFALYLNVLLPLLVVTANLRDRHVLRRMLCAAVVSVTPPLTLLVYYGILARYFFPYFASGIIIQTQHVLEVSQVAATSADPVLAIATGHSQAHPLARVVASFLSPAVPLNIGPRWLVYAVLIALGYWIWRQSTARRFTAIHLLAGLMIFSSFSAMTGIFELPAWQGRNVFIALYTGVAAASWSCIHRFPAAARRFLRSPALLLVTFLCIAGPSIYSPPAIGKNVPVADAIQPRRLPSDNQVLEELLRDPETPGQKRILAVVPPIHVAERSHLISNLFRIKDPHPRTHAFPAYHMVRTENPLHAFESDALLIPTLMLEAYPLPGDFVIHTRGHDYTFAIRSLPGTP